MRLGDLHEPDSARRLAYKSVEMRSASIQDGRLFSSQLLPKGQQGINEGLVPLLVDLMIPEFHLRRVCNVFVGSFADPFGKSVNGDVACIGMFKHDVELSFGRLPNEVFRLNAFHRNQWA